MGAKSFDPAMIRSAANRLEVARNNINQLGTTLPRSVEAGIMGSLIANQAESLAANLAAMVLQLDELSLAAAAVASRYERTEEDNVDDMKHIMPGDGGL